MPKLTEHEFEVYCLDNNISELTRTKIQEIRNSNQASRRVKSGYGNVSGRYPSKKMGFSIQFESHTLELVFIYILEHDFDVLEFYDQPVKIRLEYCSQNGKTLCHYYTPDFFVIYKDKIELIECKTEKELVVLSQKNPNRYFKDNEGKWHCPPAEAYAAKIGISFRIVSDIELNQTYVRNIRYLKDYYTDNSSVSNETADTIKLYINNEPGVTLSKLLQASNRYTADDINYLIASEKVYVDLYSVAIADQDRVRLFPNKEIAEVYSIINTKETGILTNLTPVNLNIGSVLVWDKKAFKIKAIGENKILLEPMDHKTEITEFSADLVKEMIQNGKISIISEINKTEEEQKKLEIIKKASPEDLAEATRRYTIINTYKKGDNCKQLFGIANRTLRDWKQKFRQAKEVYGDGYLGLLPNIKNRGNHESKLNETTKKLMAEFIDKKYENLKQTSKTAVHGMLLLELEKHHLDKVSFKTFSYAINDKDIHEQTLKRQGKRAAYNSEWPLLLKQDTPKHGDRIFEVAHIDHTELDILLRYGNGKTARPWLTLMIDAHSRVILASYLTFDPPSYRSCMMVIRSCVQRYGRLPQNLIVDGGKEFRGIYFEALMARYEVTLKTRPPAKSRFGSVCERMFGTTNTELIYTLVGNTQILKNVRQVTKANHPENSAVWTYKDFLIVLEKFLFETYETRKHTTLGQSPREAYEFSIATTGSRDHKIIIYDYDFKIATLPTTPRGMATVELRNGVKVNNIYYWSDAFRNSGIIGTQVFIRYDPFDMGIVYAYVDGQWVTCQSELYHIFSGMTEKELKIRSEMLRKQRKTTADQSRITAKALAEVYIDNDKIENKLTQQQEKDGEQKHLKILQNTPDTQQPESALNHEEVDEIEEELNTEEIEPYDGTY